MNTKITQIPKAPKKNKSRFGETPTIEQASTTLKAPEIAPIDSAIKSRKKTDRTLPFSTRVSEKFDREFRDLAYSKRMKHVELLEVLLEIYKKHE